MSTLCKCVARRLREERYAAGLTQVQVSKRSGLQREHVSRIESGRLDVRLETLERMAAAIGVHPASLLTERESRSDSQLARV